MFRPPEKRVLAGRLGCRGISHHDLTRPCAEGVREGGREGQGRERKRERHNECVESPSWLLVLQGNLLRKGGRRTTYISTFHTPSLSSLASVSSFLVPLPPSPRLFSLLPFFRLVSSFQHTPPHSSQHKNRRRWPVVGGHGQHGILQARDWWGSAASIETPRLSAYHKLDGLHIRGFAAGGAARGTRAQGLLVRGCRALITTLCTPKEAITAMTSRCSSTRCVVCTKYSTYCSTTIMEVYLATWLLARLEYLYFRIILSRFTYLLQE